MLRTQFNSKMTNQMLSIVNGFQEEMEQQYLYCDSKMKECQAAIVKLPHINENGDNVIHGCNLVITDLASYWLVRRDSTKSFLSDEFIKAHDVEHWHRVIG